MLPPMSNGNSYILPTVTQAGLAVAIFDFDSWAGFSNLGSAHKPGADLIPPLDIETRT